MVKYIYEEAEALKSKHGTNDPFSIIKEKGIILKYCYNFDKTQGYYYVLNGYRYIGINGNMDDMMKRVVAAHELGHDVLHRGYASNFTLHDIAIYGNNIQIERQANDFAANLLLSDKTVWDEYTNGELGTEFSSVTIFPKPLLYYKFSDMKRRGYDIPDSLIEGFR